MTERATFDLSADCTPRPASDTLLADSRALIIELRAQLEHAAADRAGLESRVLELQEELQTATRERLRRLEADRVRQAEEKDVEASSVSLSGIQLLGTKVHQYQSEVEGLINEKKMLRARIVELEEVLRVGSWR